jgi:hypothetical protein
MKHFKLILSAIILLLIIFGSWFYFFQKPKRTAPPEMILATECGQDKLKCCSDEPKCSFGQKCCPDPNDSTRDYCSDECSYGGLDEFCSATDPKCQTGLSCANGFCVPCGLAGGPCCETGAACPGMVEEGISFIECRSGTCVLCGVDGQNACAGETKCAPNHLFNNGVCYRCGDSNQACCRDEQGVQNCNQEQGLVCELGFCK